MVKITPYKKLAYPLFDYRCMTKKDILQTTINQYPLELLDIIGNTIITDTEGMKIMEQMSKGRHRLAAMDLSRMVWEDMPFTLLIVCCIFICYNKQMLQVSIHHYK